ncbi:hypothetical protein HMPREF0372_04305 [Flavonifractor plautii ATCC 29863]|uniref:Uncharacterized protein n=1 Tax=Flavonifractor plautii ATCC 29863 TaxID=411475 RepID=G9YXN8_FLAPL|nr:hypothetical protein HMPREF0372_04305 [Flavonifractor plautii ATCC 29863]
MPSSVATGDSCTGFPAQPASIRSASTAANSLTYLIFGTSQGLFPSVADPTLSKKGSQIKICCNPPTRRARPNFYKKELDKPGRRRYTVANQIGKPMTKRSSPVSMPLREPRVVESRQATLG